MFSIDEDIEYDAMFTSSSETMRKGGLSSSHHKPHTQWHMDALDTDHPWMETVAQYVPNAKSMWTIGSGVVIVAMIFFFMIRRMMCSGKAHAHSRAKHMAGAAHRGGLMGWVMCYFKKWMWLMLTIWIRAIYYYCMVVSYMLHRLKDVADKLAMWRSKCEDKHQPHPEHCKTHEKGEVKVVDVHETMHAVIVKN